MKRDYLFSVPKEYSKTEIYKKIWEHEEKIWKEKDFYSEVIFQHLDGTKCIFRGICYVKFAKVKFGDIVIIYTEHNGEFYAYLCDTILVEASKMTWKKDKRYQEIETLYKPDES